MKTIGLLGGIGPQATMDIERRLHRVAQQRIASHFNRGYPPLVVWYCRHAPVVVDETGQAIKPITPDPRLLDAAAKLGPLCDFLILGSNGADQLRDKISRVAGRPVVSIIEATLAEVRRRGWRRIGVLTLGDGAIYRDPLVAEGLACETPDGAGAGAIARAVFSVMEGRIDPSAATAVGRAVDDLRRRQVDGIILGCAELPLLLGDQADAAPGLINSNHMLAEAAVAHAMT
jgi:aspartate racemase